MEFPVEYRRKTISGAAFRAFQYLIWAQHDDPADRIEFLRSQAELSTKNRHLTVHRLSVVAFVPFPRTSAAFSKFFNPFPIFWLLPMLFFVIVSIVESYSSKYIDPGVVMILALALLVIGAFWRGLEFYNDLRNFSYHSCRLFLYLHHGKLTAYWFRGDRIGTDDSLTILKCTDPLPRHFGLPGLFKQYPLISANYTNNEPPIPVLQAFGFFLAIAYRYDDTRDIKPAFNEFIESIKQEAAYSVKIMSEAAVQTV
jgi:hypothetical protein